MNKFMFLLVCLLFLTKINAKEPIYCQLTDNITDKFTKEMYANHFFYAGGGGSFLNDVKTISLDYRCFKKYTVEEIRPIAVQSANRLLNMINSNEPIRPYLHNYPFTPRNIELTFFFRNKFNYEDFEAPYLAYASCYDGKIRYYINRRDKFAPPSPIPDYVLIHEEAFEEAEKLVNSEKSLKQPL